MRNLIWLFYDFYQLNYIFAIDFTLFRRFYYMENIVCVIIIFILFTIVIVFGYRYLMLKRIRRNIYFLTGENKKTGSIKQLITDFKQHADKLKDHEEKLEHFYNATLDGILLHDNGKILLVNQAVSNLSGYAEDELIKMSVNDVFQERRSGSGFKIPLNPYTYETQALRKDGKKFPIEVQESAIEFKGKMIIASVIRDISKRIEVENQLKEERLKRLSWVIDGQEIERQRLARELHDGLGQTMIALKLKMESIEVNDEKNKKKFDDLRNLFNKTIDEIRRMSNNLMPAGLKEFGIINAIRRLCNETSEHTGITINFESDNTINPKMLTNKCIMYMYRIAQEAITNSVKHAEASLISVKLEKKQNFYVLTIADNGKGFKFGATHKYVGNGIYNMRERAYMLEGTFNVHSELSKGTEVRVKIPLNHS